MLPIIYKPFKSQSLKMVRHTQFAHELFERVSSFCGVDTLRANMNFLHLRSTLFFQSRYRSSRPKVLYKS